MTCNSFQQRGGSGQDTATKVQCGLCHFGARICMSGGKSHIMCQGNPFPLYERHQQDISDIVSLMCFRPCGIFTELMPSDLGNRPTTPLFVKAATDDFFSHVERAKPRQRSGDDST